MQAETSRFTLQKLRSRGVNVAIDDFGTGCSSLAYLRRFPVDIVKIDRIFLAHVATDERDAAIVRTIIAMARNFALTVVAEAVEVEAQLELLRKVGCDKMQGYLLGRPVDAGAFAERIEAGAHGMVAGGAD